MSRELFGIEKGIKLLGENLVTGVSIVSGSTDPIVVGVAAEIGSIYLRTNGNLYKKIGALDTDWEILPDNTDVSDLIALTGVPAASTNLGAFTGVTIADNRSIKEALQDLETGLESNIPVKTSSAAITTAVVLDQLDINSFAAAEWVVSLTLDSNPSQRISMKVFAHHNGTATLDADAIDDVVYSKLKLGAAFNHTVSVELNGTGASQKMQLKVAGTAAISAKATRVSVDF
jgi:hypothetical protein